jgi:hypothetical protein
LITVDLNAAPTYTAIAYVWGDPKKTVVIKVDGNDLPVTTNLRDILCRIRHGFDERIVWTDGVCINQDGLD